MFMHPQCPCSRASLGELERLLVRGTDRLNVHVLFLDPGNMEEGWTRSSLWEKAKAIPGVIVSLDPGGREAAHFNAITSGQVLVYDGQGKLAFDGGLTPARGHSGDSAGRAAVLALLDENLQQPVQTSVFGCALCETSEAN